MRITILSIGSLGDVQPFLALAICLQEAGHTVRLAVSPNHKAYVERRGVKFFPLGRDNQEILDQEKTRAMIEFGKRFSFIAYRIREKQRIFYQINLQAYQACQDADLIIHRISDYLAAFSIAQKKGVPCIEVGLGPLVRTHSIPSMYFYGWPNFGEQVNWSTHLFAEQALWQIFHRSTNEFREKTLGLPPLPFGGPERLKRQSGVPVLHAFSPSVLSKPADWPEWAHITGYWFLDQERNWQPPAELVGFLEAGPAPVYIGFGSMPSRNPEHTLALLFRALELSGNRAILSAGILGTQYHPKPTDQHFFLDYAPHDWLFPRMSAVVHHGGAGTTGASIRAGTPTIVIPHNYDQPFWGQLVARLGIGPQPVPRKHLNPENLAQAIQKAVSDQRIVQNAQSLARKVQNEDGVGRAMEIMFGDR